MTRHHELQELLGAYALDAVEPDEVEDIERHLATCPRCRDELAGHREVVALLGYAGAPAPAGVWDRIVASLEEPPPALRLSAVPADHVGPSGPFGLGRQSDPLEQDGMGGQSGAGGPFGSGSPQPPRTERLVSSGARPDPAETLAPIVPLERERERRGKTTVATRMFVAIATAAAVIIAGLGIEVGRLQVRRGQNLTPAAIQSLYYQYASANPGARRVTLTSADTSKKVPAVVLPDGTSVIGKGELPVLSKDETYQLWGIVGAQQVSLRVVGTNPDFTTFTTPPNVTVLAMTVEQAGGVVSSTKAPVVSGLVPHTTA